MLNNSQNTNATYTKRFFSSEIIASVALLITVVGSAQGWLILPEKVRTITDRTDRLETRVYAAETSAQERAVTLARIDERTKRIESIIISEKKLR